MNKGDLTKAVAASAGLSSADAGTAVDAVFEAIAGAVKNRESVAIAGFGTFSAKDTCSPRRPQPRHWGKNQNC